MPDSKVGYLMSKVGELDEGLNQANSRIDQLPNGYHSLGEKETFSELPATGNEVGDSYTVRTADSEHKAGRYVWGTSKGQLVWYYLDGDNDYITETEMQDKIADDLVTDDPTKVLSAAQGVVLKEMVESYDSIKEVEVGQEGQTTPSDDLAVGGLFLRRI